MTDGIAARPGASVLKEHLKRLLPVAVRGTLRRSQALARLAWRDVRYGLLGQVLPMKPRALSFMVNDICNAGCVMCLIWQRKKDREISVEEFRRVLSEPLFSKLESIGFTGGEPTLRRDLAELFRVAAERRPRLKGASIITNAIKERQVCERVLESFHVCRDNGVAFNAMLSIDGLGEIHDASRGRKHNFESALHCLRTLTEAGVPVTIGCTITKGNAAHVDALLDWAIENDINARFRVAEFIDRLYNAPQAEYIRNFSPLERHHLGLFFHRLSSGYEPDSMIRKTYASIVGMLTLDKKRATGCPYHTDTVILTTRGELLYCSPKSPSLGSILTPGSASRAYFGQLALRRDIQEKHCDDCIHDYHVPVSFTEKLNFYFKHKRIHHRYQCRRLVRRAGRIQVPRAGPLDPIALTSRRVVIVGWYGTETAGDKAILWGIVQRLRGRARPPDDIALSSFTPWFSEWTKQELNLTDLRVVETYSRDFERACAAADEIVIGGGPLMDLESLNHMLYAFVTAARRGAVVRIEGCGLGPLREARYVAVVRELLRLAHPVTLRDRDSVRRAKEEFGVSAQCVADPACEYVHSLMKQFTDVAQAKRPVINFFLRQWPRIYFQGTDQHFAQLHQHFEEALLEFVEALVTGHGFEVNFLAMSTFAEGLDDRVYNRYLARCLTRRGRAPGVRILVPDLPMAASEIIEQMQRAALNVCMRYHSVLFAHELNTEFLAVDYTCGGKVRRFLQDQNHEDRLLSIEQFSAGAWSRYLPEIRAQHACPAD